MIDDDEEDPHKKSDLFDTSKDKVAKGDELELHQIRQKYDEDDFYIGSGSNKKSKENKKGLDHEL